MYVCMYVYVCTKVSVHVLIKNTISPEGDVCMYVYFNIQVHVIYFSVRASERWMGPQ